MLYPKKSLKSALISCLIMSLSAIAFLEALIQSMLILGTAAHH